LAFVEVAALIEPLDLIVTCEEETSLLVAIDRIELEWTPRLEIREEPLPVVPLETVLVCFDDPRDDVIAVDRALVI